MPVKTYPAEMDEAILSEIGQLSGVAVRTEVARIYPLGKKAAQAIPGARLVELPGVGHLPQVEAFEKYRDALVKFLEQAP